MQNLIKAQLFKIDKSKEFVKEVQLLSIPKIDDSIKFSNDSDTFTCNVFAICFVDGGELEISISNLKNSNDDKNTAKNVGMYFH